MSELTEDALKDWKGQIEDARALRRKAAIWWTANLKAYAPQTSEDAGAYQDEVSTNRDFTLVERKKADLFFQSPEILAIPSPLFEGQEPLLHTHTKILNELLGRDGVDAKTLVHEVLFDVLCPAGTGFTKIGYEQATREVEEIDPMTGEPITVQVPVFSQCYWRHFSPNQALIPANARTVRSDDWPWIGWEGEIALRTAKRLKWVPEDFAGNSPDREIRLVESGSTGAEAVVKFCEIFAKSSLYRDDIVHPQHLTRIVFVDGIAQPVVYEDDPDQTLDEQGQLTPDSRIGFPIHPLTIRTMTDAPLVASDCTISRPTVNELDRFREQQIEQRDANILRWMFNTDTLPTDALEKIVRSPIGGMIGVPGEAFHGEGAIKELPHGSYPRENFTFTDYLDNDLARMHGLDENQQGVQTGGGGTATEANIQQANANARLSFERGIVLDWYIRGVTKFSACVQRYLDPQKAAGIVGMPLAQEWDQWRKLVPASLAFDALPDSSLRTDLAGERKRVLDAYTFFAQDPFVNRQAFLQKIVAPRLGFPAEVFTNEPPPKGPEPAKPGFSFKGEDLNPLAPQFPIVIEILKQAGITVAPEAIQQAQEASMNALMAQQAAAVANATPGGPEGAETAHGGKVAQMESLSKHANALTGGMQSTGMPKMGDGAVQ